MRTKTTAMLAIGAVAFVATIIACKKDSDSAISIVGKWTFVDEIMGYDWRPPDTLAAHPGEYADFRSDGKVYRYRYISNYFYDTSSYQVKGSNLIVNSDTLQIQTLTANNLTIYSKDSVPWDPNTNRAIENWYNYTR